MSLEGHYDALHRDSETISNNLKSCLDDNLHNLLENSICNKNLTKFEGNMAAKKR